MIRLIKRWLELLKDEVLFICGRDALPVPLEGAEEAECIDRFVNGDQEAGKFLVERNLRLVVFLAKKYESSGLEMDDMVSVGTIGLIKAVRSFQPSKNIKLATYASRCIENEILMYLRKAVKYKNEVSLDEPLNVDSDGNELLLCDVLGTEAEIVYKNLESSCDKAVLYSSIRKLNERERAIVCMRYGINGYEEHTQKDIADMLGISQSYISRLEKRIMVRLKKEMLKLSV
ncbi:MAG: RNA polymerase sporulation sigma factor SigK [Clostridia bacterium]|nr:RNA polymerase sporulation sigma factor SigK [Clostridia bacterium]